MGSRRPHFPDGTAPKYMSLPQAARYMNIGEDFLQNLCKANRITFADVSKSKLPYRVFDRDDLDAWIAAHKIHAAPPAPVDRRDCDLDGEAEEGVA